MLGNVVYEYHKANFEKDWIGIESLESFSNIAGFKNEKQLKKFMKKIGIKVVDLKRYPNDEMRCTNYNIKNGPYFWNKKQLPRGAKKMKALSNGSLVDCYFVKDKQNKTIEIFRPNPNAKKVYHPLSLKKHIKHEKKYGIY